MGNSESQTSTPGPDPLPSERDGGGDIKGSQKVGDEEEQFAHIPDPSPSERDGGDDIKGSQKAGDEEEQFAHIPDPSPSERDGGDDIKGNQKVGNEEEQFAHIPRENKVAEEKDQATAWGARRECKYYLRPGGCKYGKACRYRHSSAETPVEKPVHLVLELKFLGLPIRPGAKECPYCMRTCSCKYGVNCRFSHPNPSAAGGSDPPSTYGNGGSSTLEKARTTQITSNAEDSSVEIDNLSLELTLFDKTWPST